MDFIGARVTQWVVENSANDAQAIAKQRVRYAPVLPSQPGTAYAVRLVQTPTPLP